MAQGEVVFTPSSGSPVTGTGQGGVIKAVDLNNDGLDDLVIGSTRTTTGGVFVRLANADGSWTIRPTLAAGIAVGEIQAADFNSDGKQDLLLHSPNPSNPLGASGAFSVYLGAGDGTFGPAKPVALPGDKVVAMAFTGQSVHVSDITGEGKPDLWFALLGGQLGLAAGYGDGTFSQVSVGSPLAEAPTGPGQGFNAIATGDFNGDDNADFIFGLIGNANGISTENDSGFYVLYGAEDSASFEAPVHVGMTSPYGPVASLLANDVDSNGYDDLIVHFTTDGAGASRFLLYRGGPDGFAQLPSEIAAPPVPVPNLVGGNFSGDVNYDLAWIQQPAISPAPATNNLVIATGSTTGIFGLQAGTFDVNFAQNQGSAAHLTEGDFNGDGAADIATSFSSSGCSAQACGTSILLNRPVVTATPAEFDFGSVAKSSVPLTLPLTITNSGGAPAKVSTIVTSGTEPIRFSLTGSCGTIAAGASCAEQVSFDRSTAGSGNGDIEIQYTGAAEPVHLTMTGTVLEPAATPDPDPQPDPVADPTFTAALKLTGPKKVKAGQKIKLNTVTTNTGTGGLDDLILKWKATQGKATRAQGSVRLATVAAGQKLAKALALSIKKKKLAKGKPLAVTVILVRQNKTLSSRKISIRLT